MKFKYQKDLKELASKMPPVYHTLPGEEFDISKSQIVEWAMQQPEIQNWLCNRIRNTGAIKYNPETKKWVGVNYDN